MRPPGLLDLLLILCLTAKPAQLKEAEGKRDQENTSKSLDIYSALRDPKTGDVRLFMEYFPKHPNDKEEGEQDPLPRDLFLGCVFSHYRNFSEKVEVEAKDIRQMAPPGNSWVDCPEQEEEFRFVKVQLQSGHVHQQVVKVEDVPAERAGAVVACVAPLFSLRPDIHHWLYYYTQLGVSRFHMYTPSLHAHEATHYNEPHEVWMTVRGFNFRMGETHTDPFHPFDHPLVTWHHYSPSNRENYFGQVLMYNECLMRSKYAYDYAVLFDVDEFIYINTTTLGRKGPVPLPQFLRATFPSKVASLEFSAYAYPKNCPATTTGSFFERHKIRDKNVLKHHIKVVVKPKFVTEVFVHFVIAVVDGWEVKHVVPLESAFLKHIVWLSPIHAVCRAYVYEDTGLAPGEEDQN
ncbi:hypothetical protein COCOBI_06-2220 [Coccomyxa sp. Obi]|nr:hypothetical protein COCOBI_06-2220 [Coccomyxa sp. Obi]